MSLNTNQLQIINGFTSLDSCTQPSAVKIPFTWQQLEYVRGSAPKFSLAVDLLQYIEQKKIDYIQSIIMNFFATETQDLADPNNTAMASYAISVAFNNGFQFITPQSMRGGVSSSRTIYAPVIATNPTNITIEAFPCDGGFVLDGFNAEIYLCNFKVSPSISDFGSNLGL